MANPRISIIIPAYNAEKTLRQCLNSVIDQTYKNYEVIVVNNNSTDKTKDIIKEFQKYDKKIKYAFEEYKSRGAARNAGLRKATGDIIAMTDSDCIVPKNWISSLTKPIRKGDELAVMGSEKNLVKNYWTENVQKYNKEFRKKNLNKKYINILDTKNFAIKSKIIKKLMFDPESGNLDDYELNLRLKDIGKIRYLPLIKVGHYHNSSFKKIIKTNFIRASLITKIYDKHKEDKNIKNEVMIKSIFLKNFLLFPLWIILQFIQKPLGESYFILVSEISWRTGVIWASLKKII